MAYKPLHKKQTIFTLPLAAGMLFLTAFEQTQAMLPPPTRSLQIVNRCTHPVEARAKQRLTRPWRNVPRRFTLEEGERLKDSRQLGGLFGIGPKDAPPPEVSFRHQGQDIASASVRRGDGLNMKFIVIACPENMTVEEKMSEDEWRRWRLGQIKQTAQ